MISRKYDLPDIGLKYSGVAKAKDIKIINYRGWEIKDIPGDIDISFVKQHIDKFLGSIVAIEIPTSLVCNLRCNYCYISDPRMKNKKVEKAVIYKIFEHASNLFPGLSKDPEKRKSNIRPSTKVYVSPWGAEPMANVETLEAVYDFCQNVYGPDQYAINTSTNGTILNEGVKNFLYKTYKQNIMNSIQVSLDGPEKLQNYQRPFVNKKGSFDRIKEFCHFLLDLQKDVKSKNKPYSFCSTIHLVEDNFTQNWADAAEFFSEPNVWHSNLPNLPMRMSGEDLSNPDHINKFIEAQKKTFELVVKRAKQGISVVDFYSYKLFGNYSCRSRNAYPYCSALNSQIAVDLDGSIYPCHGPITTPLYKPFLWFGNLFEKTISFKQYYRNISYQYGILWNLGRCQQCPIYHYSQGHICWSCPPHNLSLTGEPSMDSVLKCVAYGESFKYWVAIAKIVLTGQQQHNIPRDWFNDIDINFAEFKNKKINVDVPKNVHFDMKYDGIIDNAVKKYTFDQRDNYGYEKYIDEWWTFDDYINKTLNQNKV